MTPRATIGAVLKVSRDLAVMREAALSPCGEYRYYLSRTWKPQQPVLVFIGLNPSKADHEIDDATVRVCMGRARRMGCGGVRLFNLFAWRATSPHELRLVADPIGPECDEWIARAVSGDVAMVIAAWGDGGLYQGRAPAVAALLCGPLHTPLWCLGVTRGGQPRHPLRLGYWVEPVLWRRAA